MTAVVVVIGLAWLVSKGQRHPIEIMQAGAVHVVVVVVPGAAAAYGIGRMGKE